MGQLKSVDIFSAAAREFVRLKLKHGQKQKLAEKMGVHPVYLSDLLRGRKQWTDQLKDKFAEVIGVSVTDLYIMGEEFLETGYFFPYNRLIIKTPEHSIERALKVFDIAAKEYKLGVHDFFTKEMLLKRYPKDIQKYVDGELQDSDIYVFAQNFCDVLLENYSVKTVTDKDFYSFLD